MQWFLCLWAMTVTTPIAKKALKRLILKEASRNFDAKLYSFTHFTIGDMGTIFEGRCDLTNVLKEAHQ